MCLFIWVDFWAHQHVFIYVSGYLISDINILLRVFSCMYGLCMYVCMYACMAWHGMAWHGMAWHGMAWHGMALHCIALHCMDVRVCSLGKTNIKLNVKEHFYLQSIPVPLVKWICLLLKPNHPDTFGPDNQIDWHSRCGIYPLTIL